MSFLPITASFAALFAIVLVLLSMNVIRHRVKVRATVGDRQNDLLTRSIRVQGNFTEYVPLFLIVSAFVESAGYSAALVCTLGTIMMIGRLSHAFGLLYYEPAYPKTWRGLVFRQIGMICTFGSLLTAAVLILGSV